MRHLVAKVGKFWLRWAKHWFQWTKFEFIMTTVQYSTEQYNFALMEIGIDLWSPGSSSLKLHIGSNRFWQKQIKVTASEGTSALLPSDGPCSASDGPDGQNVGSIKTTLSANLPSTICPLVQTRFQMHPHIPISQKFFERGLWNVYSHILNVTVGLSFIRHLYLMFC